MLTFPTTVFAIHRVVQIRCLSASVVCNKPKWKEQYRYVEQILTDRGVYQLHPEKILYKLLYRDKKINPFFVHPPVAASTISTEVAVASVHSARICTSKRVRVLNKLFMRYIPEILATSHIGLPLFKYDIQFSGVKVGSHYDIINVYWVPKGTEEDIEIQDILNQVAYPLRSELINLRLMGLVPRINFAKDKRIAYLKELDRRMKIADYGENYIPSFLIQNPLKEDLQLEVKLPNDLREQIISLDAKDEFTHQEEADLPPMAMNTFGLDYRKIMNTIMDGKKRAKKLDIENQSIETLIGETTIKEVPFNYEAQAKQSWDRKSFTQYLMNQRKKRKLLIKARNREFSDAMREAARMPHLTEEDTEGNYDYTEFVENAFPDIVEDLPNDIDSEKIKYEQ